MPELPEVETVLRSLKPKLLGKKIVEITVNLPKLIKIPPGDETTLRKNITGSKFVDVKRRGKYLLFYLDNGWVLVIHLRMTGRLLYLKNNQPVEKHTHLIFDLNDEYQLRFHDVRQFGLIYLVPQDSLDLISGLKNLGPEPLSSDFTLDYLQEILKGKRKKAKTFLLDQQEIAGIGNIYADEILFRAWIHPEKPVVELSTGEIEAFWQAIKEKLSQGIKYRGTSIKDYVDGDGRSGSFQEHLKVYGKAGEYCPNCGCAIEKIIVAGRSTCFCPHCQRK
ncbi:MAG: DNA-formamidopyrimidine glycosylase [Clostridia bacterium]|nr:DNA-formamidopyrimidine glycosylase [Clostridia bacterium]